MDTHLSEVRVARAEDIPAGGVLRVDVDGTPALLARVDGTVRALRDSCSHEGAPLSEGEVEDGTVECPWHFSRFCLRTGEALDLPATDPVEMFRVREADGEILISR
ncbi:non-heme iron oxygenase ferredoxin subunit [Streptomyces sp. CAU 1734]|uniref:Rieske (2Fe-2S) protein n=1 Tax=Streptomyces sp. CAU 1734 TaxID=3140360 RepID=UPI00326109BC